MPRIIFTDLDRKQTIELKDKLITIGRAPDNAIVLRDDSISSYHAVLKEKDGNYSLQDLDSTNGMKVDGHRVKSADLEDGTNLKLGDVVGTYESEVPVPKKSAGPTADVPQMDLDSSSSKKLKLSDRKPVDTREEADVSKPTKDKEQSKSKTPPPAVKRSKQISKPKKSKKGSGCGLLLFTALALIAPFAGMAFRHYQDTNEWLPVQVWEKISGKADEEKEKDPPKEE